jgi:hypothetical protein
MFHNFWLFFLTGILQRSPHHDPQKMVIFGYDSQKAFRTDTAFTKFFESVSKELFLKESTIIDGEGKERSVFSGIEAKGIKGTDGRHYLFEVFRLTPRGKIFSCFIFHVCVSLFFNFFLC